MKLGLMDTQAYEIGKSVEGKKALVEMLKGLIYGHSLANVLTAVAEAWETKKAPTIKYVAARL